MGCRLQKPCGSDEAPGKIYSTLRRAQLESHVGVAYTYHYLDFLLGKEEVGVSSVLCLSSVRELPVQVGDLYQQGFILASVHPFVHSCGPAEAKLQRQLHRAVLIRETHRCLENGLVKCVRPRLETDVCYSGTRVPDPDVVQGYVKKVQDQADSGILLVGLLQQPGGAPCYRGNSNLEDLSSLHSSPSPTHAHYPDHRRENQDHQTTSPSLTQHGQSRQHKDCTNPQQRMQDTEICKIQNLQSLVSPQASGRNEEVGGGERETLTESDRTWESKFDSLEPHRAERRSAAERSLENQKPEPTEWEQSPTRLGKRIGSNRSLNRVQIFALYNHAVVLSASPRFYSLRIPIQVHREAGLITKVDAHWLDHMSPHFRSGAQLIDGYFHLGDDAEFTSTVDGVFIFQSASDIMTTTVYDAIVVEQWTVIDGVAVKTDYIPLLQSLAPYGWRLMCVLPTPITKTSSDGSLATKQILFLQRPVLTRRRRDFTKLHLKGRNKRNLNSNETAGSEVLHVASLPSSTLPETEKAVRNSEEKEDRNDGRTPRVTRQEDGSREEVEEEEEEVELKTVKSQKDGKGTQREEVRSLVTERALFSGVC